MSKIARHLRAFVIAIAVLALSATVVLGARGLPSLTAALTGSGTTAEAGAQNDQGEDADDQGADTDAPDEDAAEDGDADADAPAASEEDGSGAPDASEPDAPATDTHGSMVSTAAGMDTPDGFANHGAFVSCVARQNHGHLADGATPIPPDQLTPTDCAKDAEDASVDDAAAPAGASAGDKVKGKSAAAHDKSSKGHGKGHGHGH